MRDVIFMISLMGPQALSVLYSEAYYGPGDD